MQIFNCDSCQSVVFFENDTCLTCGAKLAFLPELMVVGSLKQDASGVWRSSRKDSNPDGYRLCKNGTEQHICNEAVPATSKSAFCRWCRYTRVIPDLSLGQNKGRWRKLHVAQRRLLYSIFKLGLEVKPKLSEQTDGLCFEFLADTSEKVFTGHKNGVITLNIAEADDAEREGRREQMGERYRTLLGHFRHEVGHYFWERLIFEGNATDSFRKLFGDERVDYSEALNKYYSLGAPPTWQNSHISRYATAHPWEDWAETWAHYLHMTAVLETASSCGLSLAPDREQQPSIDVADLPDELGEGSFRQLIDGWVPVTQALNSLNRSIGLNDAYPFVLSGKVVEKLEYVHNVVRKAGKENSCAINPSKTPS